MPSVDVFDTESTQASAVAAAKDGPLPETPQPIKGGAPQVQEVPEENGIVVNGQHDDKSEISALQSLDGWDSLPCSSTVVTSLNGVWKQENFDWQPTAVNGIPSPDSLSDDLETESEDDFPTEKYQPLLRNESTSSESQDSSDDDEDEKLPNAGRLKNRATSSSVASRHAGSSRKSHMVDSARAKLLAALKVKKRLGNLAMKTKLATMCPDRREPYRVGDLVWARPKRPVCLPWWPSIIVHRPRKLQPNVIQNMLVKGVYESYVPEFRICPLGPVQSGCVVSVPQDRIRPYRGRDEFDNFLRETVLQAENKVKALCQFVIQPSLQQSWQLAREAAEVAHSSNTDSVGRLAMFPWINDLQSTTSGIASFVIPGSSSIGTHARYPRKRLHKSSSSDSDASDASDLESENLCTGSTASTSSMRRRFTKSKKYGKPGRITDVHADEDQKGQNGFVPKDLVNSFEFERLRFVHITPKRIFVCSVCAKPGEHGSKLNGTEHGPKKNTMEPTVVDVQYPSIDPCIGGCGTYLHPACARQIQAPAAIRNKPHANPSDPSNHDNTTQESLVHNSQEATKVPSIESQNEIVPPVPRMVSICESCYSGVRRCFICNLKQPCSQIFNALHASDNATTETAAALSSTAEDTDHVKDDPSTTKPSTGVAGEQMIRCSIKLCSRWFHPSCLRRPPFSAVVRDRKAGAFSCPAHTCLACTVENPGTIPRPTARYIRCFLCPVAYHPGEWCLPAGSKEIAPNWIICPRHALGEHYSPSDVPESLLIPPLSHPLATMFRPTNVSWCFICSKGGRIICCEQCPASFHEECLKIDEVPEQFVCEDCSNGRSPRYGEIIWARLPPNLNSVRQQGQAGATNSDDRSSYASLTVGTYWWPAEVVHPRHLLAGSSYLNAITDGTAYETCDSPSKHNAAEEHALGLFPVRLFGLTTNRNQNGDTRDPLPIVLWTTRARLFPYEEGDDKREVSSSDSSEDELNTSGRRRNSSLDDGEDEDPLLQIEQPTTASDAEDQSSTPKLRSPGGQSTRSPLNLRPRGTRRQQLSQRASKTSQRKSRSITDPALIKQRKDAHDAAIKQAAAGWNGRREKFGQLLGRTRKPDYYKPIKVNWPLGSVRVYRLTDPSEAPRCECRPTPTGTSPCGPNSNCINRELHYECVPSVCPNGEACENQRFTKRLYPAQRPFWTGDERGWGLKTLVPIKEGEFVNEYIGDLIDEEEANRRLRFAHENNVTNYYMMKLDAQRIIDAGPKGNLSRFMNHSCDPNLNTQKWTVNGDNRIGLFAVRDIAPGEELTFNYNFVALGQERLNCRCGASNCAGFLGTSSIGTHNSQRPAEDEVPGSEHRSKRLGNNSESNKGGPDSGKNGGGNGLTSSSGRSANSMESALIRQARHETICYRCGASVAPDQSMQTGADGSDRASSTVKSKEAHVKRGTVHELGELVTNGPSTNSDDGSSTHPSMENANLIYCCKPDCSKTYHLQCLNLDNPPLGRWRCPWHHCDACGRPSHIFCSLCPASFCVAHVEGSIAVLQPQSTPSRYSKLATRNRKSDTGTAVESDAEVARVVCMSHSELIRESKEQLPSTPADTRKPLAPVNLSPNSMTSPVSSRAVRRNSTTGSITKARRLTKSSRRPTVRKRMSLGSKMPKSHTTAVRRRPSSGGFIKRSRSLSSGRKR